MRNITLETYKYKESVRKVDLSVVGTILTNILSHEKQLQCKWTLDRFNSLTVALKHKDFYVISVRLKTKFCCFMVDVLLLFIWWSKDFLENVLHFCPVLQFGENSFLFVGFCDRSSVLCLQFNVRHYVHFWRLLKFYCAWQ